MRAFKLIVLIFFIFLVVVLCTYSDLECSEISIPELESSFVDIVDKVKPGVVHIETERREGRSFLGRAFEAFKRYLTQNIKGFEREGGVKKVNVGTGFVIDEDGHILTVAHLVRGASEVKVGSSYGEKLPAEVLGVDPDADIAVLKVKAPSPFYPLEIGDSNKLKAGQWVLSISAPYDSELYRPVSMGIVSAVNWGDPRVNIDETFEYDYFIRTSVLANKGDSGSPLVNIKGQVVGVNFAIQGQGAQGITYAVPINLAMTVADRLIRYRKVSRGWLGIVATDTVLERGVRGILVLESIKGTPAYEVGLDEGDVIVKVDDVKVSRVGELKYLLLYKYSGKEVDITIIRGGEEILLKATVEERKKIIGGEDLVIL